MKRSFTLLLTILSFSFFLPTLSHAQSVIYYCAQTGSIGYAYTNTNDGHDLNETGGKDMKELEKNALAQCQQQGGTRCGLLYATPKPGWSGIIKGRDQNGTPIVLAVGHQQSEKYAQSELDRKYFFKDGIQYDDVLILTWKVE